MRLRALIHSKPRADITGDEPDLDALQADLQEIFDAHETTVTVDRTQTGISIKSRDPRIDAMNAPPKLCGGR